MERQPKPFDCSYSPQFAELLSRLGISLAISTYQAGKVVFISAEDKDKLVQLPRTFENAMGMAYSRNILAISTRNEVVVLHNRPELAPAYPSKKGVYDGIYIPAARYNTGHLALHDMEFISDRLVAVNTLFSCLSYIGGKYSFEPFWQPGFITELRPEDRCHLNGIAADKNEIRYLTALGDTNAVQGWREKKMKGGILMEYPSGEIILEGLAMPHSPRIYNGRLYLLNSAQGELLCVDTEKRNYEVVVNLGGFARGMARFGDYLFIGVSKLRHNSEVFRDLDIAKTSFAGVIAVYLPYNSIAGSFRYEMSVDEIYDVKVIEGSLRPSILSPEMPLHGHAITTPRGSFWSNPETNKSAGKTHHDREHGQKSEEEKISYRIIKNTNGKSLMQEFPGLLFPVFLKKIEHENRERSLLAIVATAREEAVALAVSELRSNSTAELHSVFVAEKFRKKGIATHLLQQIDKVHKEHPIQYIDVSWADAIQETTAFENLIRKSHWLPPQRTIVNVKLHVDSALKATWKDELPGTNDNTGILDWAEVTEREKEEIRLLEKEEGFPKYLTPFQLPGIVDKKISKVLRVEGKIAGWCIFHTIKNDTAQCSSLYIRQGYRNKLRSMKLLADSFIDAQKKNIRYINYQISYQDKSLEKFLDTLTADKAVVRKYHTLASRKYYTAQPDEVLSS